MNIPITPELITGVVALITAGVSHYRLSKIPEKVLADAKLAAAVLLADSLIAASRLKADAVIAKENLK
jgi:hypothetical protein